MEADYEIEVAHRSFQIGAINKQIMNLIYESDLVIADLTDNNPNVMYELAVRHTLGSPCIIIAEEGTKLPFDIASERTFFYSNEIGGEEGLIKVLKECLRQINYDDMKSMSPIHSYIDAEKILKKIMNYLDKPIASLMLSDDLVTHLPTVGLSAFYTKRDDFRLRKSDDNRSLYGLKDYLGIAKKSIKVISFTYALGVVYEDVKEVFRKKLESSNFTIDISLLNPYNPIFYSSCFLSHDRRDSEVLIVEAKESVKVLSDFRNSLEPQKKKRFNIKFHDTALFDAATLIDDGEDGGRIQIDNHLYKVPAPQRLSFEIRKSDDNIEFYNRVRDSYNRLLEEATGIDDLANTQLTGL